jgi:hypothetical protein
MSHRGPDGRFAALSRSTAVAPTCGGIQTVRRTARPRKDAWTPLLRERFLVTLAETCNVKMACAAAGKSDVGAYKLRQRDPSFRAAWRRALGEGYARLEIQLLERALIGEAKLREAIDVADPARAIDLLGRYSPRTAELLYRTHRAEALAGDAADDDDAGDGEAERQGLIASIMAKLAAAEATLIAERGGA